MKTFQCVCGQPVFFNNSVCIACGRAVGFDPDSREMRSLENKGNGVYDHAVGKTRERGWFRRPVANSASQYRFCANLNNCACNWLIPANSSSNSLCPACSTSRTIPNLVNQSPTDNHSNTERWIKLETAKRRLLYTLLDLQLWGNQSRTKPTVPLVFDFLQPLPNQAPVMTGHESGVITINVQEADDEVREATRFQLREPYRSVLGHFRHEVGHYYWDVLIKNSRWLQEFRNLFGNETVDYGAALQRHYTEGARGGWEQNHISAYATSHPWEDWAETWAHYLNMRDTLETAEDAKCTSTVTQPSIDPATLGDTSSAGVEFCQRMARWVALTTLVNELTRSMGQPDAYPFVCSGMVLKKLYFIERVLTQRR